MAQRKDITLERGQSQTYQYQMVTTATPALILAGHPCKKVSGEAVQMGSLQGTTTEVFVGIAKENDTSTSSAKGIVQLWWPVTGLLYRAKDTTATNSNTRALINALVGKRVTFNRTADTTSGTFTIDSSVSNSASNGVIIVDGDPLLSELIFAYSVTCSIAGNDTTA